jgi:hypothetical protein
MMSLLCKKRGTGGHNKLETTYFVKQWLQNLYDVAFIWRPIIG